MFYRVETNQPETISCFPPLSLESLKTILKINLMTLFTVTMLLSNHVVGFYVIYIDGCTSENVNLPIGSKVVLVVLILIIFPFMTKWKLHEYHLIRDKEEYH